MSDRNRELVPDNWSLVRERVLTSGLCLEGWHSEHAGVCRRAELPGRSVHRMLKLLNVSHVQFLPSIRFTTVQQSQDGL